MLAYSDYRVDQIKVEERSFTLETKLATRNQSDYKLASLSYQSHKECHVPMVTLSESGLAHVLTKTND